MTDRQIIMCFPLPTDNVGVSYIALSLYRELRNQGRPVSFITPVVRRHAFDLGVRQAVPWGLRMLPWRHLRRLAGFHYRRAILGAIRPGTIVDFWGDNAPPLLAAAKKRGAVVVKEKFNCAQEVAREILSAEFRRLGRPFTSSITDASIRSEFAQCAAADHVLSPSPMVRDSLRRIGVPDRKIIETSFGWEPIGSGRGGRVIDRDYVRPWFLYVGTVEIRKGAHLLLQYWKEAAAPGTLFFLGRVKDEMRPFIDAIRPADHVVLLGHREKAHHIYDEVDAFVFPSLEEGGPLVTYEAMGHGLPVIVSPMGAGAVAQAGLNGIVIPPQHAPSWLEAIRQIGADSAMRKKFSTEAKTRAQDFTWPSVAAQRHASLIAAVQAAP